MKRQAEPGLHGAERAIHIGLISILLWLAFYCMAATDLFATDREFSYMARLAPERAWSILFLIAANLGAVSLLARSVTLKLFGVLVTATTHGVFALSLILASAGIWSGTFAVIAAMGYFLSFRLTRASAAREASDARIHE